MPKTVTLRLDDEVYTLFASAARAQKRSIANLIQTAALAKVEEQQFVDEYEMAEILANERLLDSLKQGSRDARRAKGRFVE